MHKLLRVTCISYSGLHQIHEQTWNDKNSPAKSAKVCAKNLYAAPFTYDELKRFFNACDNTKPRRGRLATIQRMTLPVFFRLLYSSGMRTTEAILLERDDVNLENGVISIKRSKGHDQHYVVLHDTMLALMRTYDENISRLVPHRKVFFPTPDDKSHPSVWVTYHFGCCGKVAIHPTLSHMS